MSKEIKRVMTPEFRVSFPAIFEPRSFENQTPKYSVVMLFDKKQNLDALKQLAQAAIESKWPDKEKRPKNLRHPFRDGDVEKPGVDGYAGKLFISASSKSRVGLVDKNLVPIIEEDEFYAGCYARATITAFAYDTMGNKGVAFGLQNIQKLRDGDRFSGRVSASEDFEVFDDGGEETSTSSGSGDMFS